MLIGGLQRLSLIDFPGKICATVFTIGCNFFCAFCHNPELVDPMKIKKQPLISEKEFFEFLASRQGILEGVCVTGGEPTIHKDLPEFIKKIKKLGFSVKLDTNGSNPKMLKKLIKNNLLDYISMDIKGPLKKYEEIAGLKIDLEKIKESVKTIRQTQNYEFRTTVVPLFHKKEDFLNIAEWLKGSSQYFLQQFRPGKNLDKKFEKEKPYSKKELEDFYEAIKSYFDFCEVRD